MGNYWDTMLSEQQKALWTEFLLRLGYNSERDEILAVNEFLAYMSTESQLFAESRGGTTELCKIQEGFIATIEAKVPKPPCVGQAGCVWQLQKKRSPTQDTRS